MSVTLASTTYWADWPYPSDTTFEVRAKSNRAWVDEDLQIIAAGKSRVVGTGTITALRPTLPNITLPTTAAGLDDQTAKWTITLHRTGRKDVVDTVLADFSLPISFEPAATWAQVKIHKNGKQPLRDTSVYTKTETDTQIALAAGTLNKASDVIEGRTKLSVAPVSASAPIAVGDNDPRIITTSFYATLAAAITAIGSDQTTLVVDAPIAAAGATSPANITLRFTHSGQLTGTGTVTILGPIEAPPRKIFATTLTVSLTGNAFVNKLCVDWFETIVTNVTDATAAWQKAIDTFNAANKSGNVLFQNKVYRYTHIALPERPTTNLALGFIGVPPDARSVIAVDTAGTVLLNTLTSGTGSTVDATARTFLSLYIHNITFRMQPNPTNTCLDMSKVVVFTFGDLKIDTGEVFDSTTQPTTTTSYGLKMPQVNQAGITEGHSVLIQGFYTGILGGELTNITAVTVANCVYAMETPAAFHPNYVGLFLDEHNVHGIRATGGDSWWRFGLYDTEKAVAGWFTRVDDIVDASNFLHARLTWHEVTVNVGVTHTFTKVGGAYVYDQELHGTGTEIFSSFNGQNPKLFEINSNKAVSASTNVPWVSLVHNQSGTAEAAGAWSVSNLAIAASEKRLAQIAVQTNGAVDTGRLNFSLNTAGTFALLWIMRGSGLIAATDGGVDIGTLTDFRPDNIHAKSAMVAGSVRGRAVAFASLPASPVEGMMVAVTDSNTNTWGATIAGGGANHVLAYYNGSAWTVVAK